jgi:hypothetical protein
MKKATFISIGLFLIVGSLGFAQGPPPDGGFQGGGRGGGGRGGFRGGNPADFFNRLSGGKDVIDRSTLDPNMQRMFDRMAGRLGITNGQITRDQFMTMSQNRGQRGGGGGGDGGGGGRGGPPGDNASPQGGPSPDRTKQMADRMFRQLDVNGDGVLNNDEMPEALKAERDKWDTDHNGLIDQTEFLAYFQARVQQFMIDRNGQGNSDAPDSADPLPLPEATPPPEPEIKRPVVYRSGKLPKELPAWFQQLDTDNDAQIGLYEWKASGRPIEEFLKMDRNNDGFLTVQEVLSYLAKNKGATTAVAGGPAPPSPPGDSAPGRPAFTTASGDAAGQAPGGNGQRNGGGQRRGGGGRGGQNRSSSSRGG